VREREGEGGRGKKQGGGKRRRRRRGRSEVGGGDWPGALAVAGRSPRLVTPLGRVRVAGRLDIICRVLVLACLVSATFTPPRRGTHTCCAPTRTHTCAGLSVP